MLMIPYSYIYIGSVSGCSPGPVSDLGIPKVLARSLLELKGYIEKESGRNYLFPFKLLKSSVSP
jgi:hypothetical protein